MRFVVLSWWLPLVCLPPSLSFAESQFAGTWIMQPELTTFGGRPLELLIEGGMYRLENCRAPLEVAADGADHLVKDQPLFDAMSVRLAGERRIEIVQKMASKVAWKGTYTVAKDGRSMTLVFEDDRPANAVSGTIDYVRDGSPVPRAHAISGTWRPDKLVRLSASGSTLMIRDEGDGLAMSWGDGRSIESKLNASYYPLTGYLGGCQGLRSQLPPRHARDQPLARHSPRGGIARSRVRKWPDSRLQARRLALRVDHHFHLSQKAPP